MKLLRLAREIRNADLVLWRAGCVHLLIAAACLAAYLVDSRTVTGINAWIKPGKFALSFTVYLWTVAWFLALVPAERQWPRPVIRWGVASVIGGETICIALQAARGVTSHYNVSTLFDSVVFMIMGILILINTGLMVLLLVLFLIEDVRAPRAYMMGIRMGIVLFLFGSLEGMVMILNQAHTMGAPDGGPGLPLLNWSTRAGDLRIAHGAGLHALQALPFAGYWISRLFGGAPLWFQLVLMSAFSGMWAFFFLALFRHAVRGLPLIAM